MDTAFGTVTAIVLLLLANGFFVAAEFSLVKARSFRIDALAADGRMGAKLTQKIQRHLEAYLAACQLGITMASLGLGWVGEPAVEALFRPLFNSMQLAEKVVHTTSFLIGFVLFSSLHIVIGEQVPKTFAIRKAEPVSLWVAYPLQAFYLLAYPLNWALNRASGSILALFKVEEATHADVLTDEELRGLISVSTEHGELRGKKAEMLSNLFAFDERTVGRVMIPGSDVYVLDLKATPQENAEILRVSGHSRFPLVDGDPSHPVGVVLAKEIYAAVLDGGPSPLERLAEFSRPPLVVPESLRIARLFETMRSKRAHMALVVDEYGEFIGVVTLEDLLEEIVGDIDDETDQGPAKYAIDALDENKWRAHGLASLADVQRAIGLVVPPDLGANTLSGLFMQRLGRMPAVGDQITEKEFRLSVEAMEANRVDQVRLEKLSPHEIVEMEEGGETKPHAGGHPSEGSG
jgi:CBS domain containing-hemolysin-like protein